MRDIVLKILGTAQDGGYPQPGCDCPNCQRALNNKEVKRFPASLGVLDLNPIRKSTDAQLIHPLHR